ELGIPAQGAAAHQEGIHEQTVAGPPDDTHGDQTEVAELVTDVGAVNQATLIGEHFFDRGGIAANAVEVELVRPLEQLGNPGNIRRRYPPRPDPGTETRLELV